MSLVFLVGLDCSDCSNRAVDYAAERAKFKDARLLVAHVIEWSPFQFSTVEENAERHKRREEELQRARKDIIEPVVQRLRAAGVDAQGVARHGHVAETLDQLAHEFDVTNIVVGRHGSSRLKGHMFGGAVGMLVQISDRPVTVVP